MAKLEDMIKDFKSMAELQAFANAQYKTIMQLTQKLAQVEEEKRQAESLLVQTNPLLVTDGENRSLSANEEEICRTQLHLLNQKSKLGELTAEDSRKVDLFAKLLLQLRSGNKEKSSDLDKKDTKSLLELVASDEK